MKHRHPLALVVLVVGLMVVPGMSRADDKDKDKDNKDNPQIKAMLDCAKACNDCQRECDICARHCADLLAAGKKDHLKTLGTCTDCAEFCSTAARMMARRSPMSPQICEGCLHACENCGAECEKFKDDEHMKRCAEECKKCAKACREMLKYKDKIANTE